MTADTLRLEKILVKRERERRRCGTDFSRWINQWAWIEDKEKKAPMKFKLWPSQVKILPKILTSLLLAILKARQLGLTWLCAAYSLWFVIYHPMKLVVVISAKGEWAIEFIERVYFILQRLPDWTIHPVKIIKDTSEVFRVEHPDGTQSTIKSLTTTEAGAQSKTPDLLILDETCWNPYIRQIFNASKPGIEAAKGRIIVISNSIKTAPGWGWTRSLITDAIKGDNTFDYLFMPWQARPGRPENFREEQIRGGMDEEDCIEHYPETIDEAISALTGSYFGKTLARHVKQRQGHIGALKKDKDKNITFERADKGVLEIWRYPYHMTSKEDPWTQRYCIGSDISEGLGASYSVAYVYDRLKQEKVARLRSNRIDAYTWADMLYNLSRFYCYARKGGEWFEVVNALICVETTGAGQTTVRRLEHLKGVTLYMEQAAPKAGSELTMRFGWHETSQKKYDLSEDLRNWFRHTTGTEYCRILIDEASTWIQHENRQIGPEDDSKLGDCVIAAGLTLQADTFMGGKPKQIPPPLAGWRKRQAHEGESAWI